MENKVELKKYVEELKIQYNIDNKNFIYLLSKYLNDNNWFGFKPLLEDDHYYVTRGFINKNKDKIELFCKYHNASFEEKLEVIENLLIKELPDTAIKFLEFANERKLEIEARYYLIDCILYNLPGELVNSSDKELRCFMIDSLECLTTYLYNILCFFVAWVKDKYKVTYTQLYTYETNIISNKNNEAYELDEYLRMLYCFYNEDYIQENNMYVKAAKSKNYVDTWLFISLHFISALRSTDSIRLPHPKLINNAKETLNRIINNTFKDSEAVYILNTVLWELKYKRYVPNKTKRFSNVETIKLEVPHSVEVHIGKLFAIAEAHFQLSGASKNEPLIRVITTYAEIERYMGEEIGELFRKSDFRIRSANKSYLQAIELLTSKILGVENDFHVKGYILASLARTHKGSYGKFAETTLIYLKDAKISGYSLKFVTRELFERGALSSIPALMISMITNGEFDTLSAREQTAIIKEYGLTPYETENAVVIAKKAITKGLTLASNITKDFSKENVLRILHNIADGSAAAKDGNCMCFLSALGLGCPFSNHCGCCEFEIATKATLYSMVRELYRQKAEYKKADTIEKEEKSKYLIEHHIAPAIDEMLKCYQELYGKEEMKRLEVILKETAYDKN